jgi:hypothetical protein
MVTRAARPLLAVEPGQALLEEALAPVPDRRDREAHLARDRGVVNAVRRRQHDARSPHQALRRGPRPNQIDQAGSLDRGQLDLLLAWPAHAAPPAARDQHAAKQNIINVISGTLH